VVDVNLKTGYPKVVRIVGAFDCGRAINPLSVLGQVEGAIVQGLGYSVMEEVCTMDGHILNPNLADYFLYTSVDAPKIETILVKGYPSSLGPFRAKAMAEPPIDIVAPAILRRLRLLSRALRKLFLKW
jgi:CO/xanthine dehydrogenase Mo-binding subunit